MEVWTEQLLSKWGLEDGDILDPILTELGFDLTVVNTSHILVDLIIERVLPKIENTIEYEVIISLHNPIRITRVDGVEIDNYKESHPGVHLRPQFVEVPNEIVRDYANRWLADQARDEQKPG